MPAYDCIFMLVKCIIWFHEICLYYQKVIKLSKIVTKIRLYFKCVIPWPVKHSGDRQVTLGYCFWFIPHPIFSFDSKNIIDVSDIAKNSLLYFSFDAVYGYGYFTRSVLKCYTTLLVKTFDTLRQPFAQVA